MTNTALPEAPVALSPPALAKRYGLSPESIIRWIRAGELRAVDVSGRPGETQPRFRVHLDDWEAFLRGREVNPKPAAPEPAKRRSRRRKDDIIEFF